MQMRQWSWTVIVVALGVLGTGCERSGGNSMRNPTAASPTPSSSSSNTAVSPAALTGTWRSTSSTVTGQGFPAVGTCGNFGWTVTSNDGTTVTGDFSATCDGQNLTGTGTGIVTGSSLTFNASGTTDTGQGPCSFTMTGSATLNGNTLRIEYTGSSCVGPFSGNEVLTRS